MKPDIDNLEFPVFTAENPPLESPRMSPEEWVAWLEEARSLQPREVFEEWLSRPLPFGPSFELLD